MPSVDTVRRHRELVERAFPRLGIRGARRHSTFPGMQFDNRPSEQMEGAVGQRPPGDGLDAWLETRSRHLVGLRKDPYDHYREREEALS